MEDPRRAIVAARRWRGGVHGTEATARVDMPPAFGKLGGRESRREPSIGLADNARDPGTPERVYVLLFGRFSVPETRKRPQTVNCPQDTEVPLRAPGTMGEC